MKIRTLNHSARKTEGLASRVLAGPKSEAALGGKNTHYLPKDKGTGMVAVESPLGGTPG